MTIISSGTYSPKFAVDAWATMKKYADKVGAAFINPIEEPIEHPYRNQFKTILKNVTDPEEVVLWFDWDITVKDTAANLFELFKEEDALYWFDLENWGGVITPGRDQRKHVPELYGAPYMIVAMMMAKQKTFAKLDAAITPELIAIGMQGPHPPGNWEISVNVAVRRCGIKSITLPEGMHVPPWQEKTGHFIHEIGHLKYSK